MLIFQELCSKKNLGCIKKAETTPLTLIVFSPQNFDFPFVFPFQPGSSGSSQTSGKNKLYGKECYTLWHLISLFVYLRHASKCSEILSYTHILFSHTVKE